MNKLLLLLLCVGCAHVEPHGEYRSPYAEGRYPGSGGGISLTSTPSSPTFAGLTVTGDILAASITLTNTSAITFDVGDRLVHGGAGGNYCRGEVDGSWGCSAGVSTIAGRLLSRNATGGLSVGTAGSAVVDIPAGTTAVNWTGAVHNYATTKIRSPAQVFTCPDNGGGTAAACTYDSGYTMSVGAINCQDANGCNITMSETSIGDGETICMWNQSANVANFADTANVTELTAAFAMGQYDSLCLYYAVDRWIEISRSNN